MKLFVISNVAFSSSDKKGEKEEGKKAWWGKRKEEGENKDFAQLRFPNFFSSQMSNVKQQSGGATRLSR